MPNWVTWSNFISLIKNAVPWLGTIFGVHQWLYNKSPKYYFIIKKVLQRWKDTKWDINAVYTVQKNDDIFKKIEKVIKNIFPSYNKTFNLKNKKQYEFGNYVMIVQYDIDCSQTNEAKLEFIIKNMNVTYKNSKRRLEELRILFNELEKEILPSNKEYCMDIYFTDLSNPFYGLMIQRLGEEKIRDFECVFPIEILEINQSREEDDNCFLRVFKNKITLNEENYFIIEKIAKKCLLVG